MLSSVRSVPVRALKKRLTASLRTGLHPHYGLIFIYRGESILNDP